MNNKIHLVSNAHLDPIWLWRWQEGCGEVLQTFRSAVEKIKEYQKWYELYLSCIDAAEELKEKEQYRKYEENKKEYWRKIIANMSTEEIVNILVDLSTNEDDFDYWKYDEYYYEEEDE
jgi:hypothetical protein